MIREYQRLLNFGQVCLDGFTLLVAYTATVLWKLHYGYLYDRNGLHVVRPLWMILILMCAYHVLGVYTPMRTRLFRTEAAMVARAHLAGFLAIFAVLFIDRTHIYSREVYLLFVTVSFFCLVLERYAVRRVLSSVRRRGYNQKFMLVVGAGELGVEFLERVRANRTFGYRVIGFVDDEAKPGTLVHDVPVLGGTELLPQLLGLYLVDEVIVASRLDSYQSQGRIMDACEEAGVRMSIIPGSHQRLSCYTYHVEDVDGISLLSVRRSFPV